MIRSVTTSAMAGCRPRDAEVEDAARHAQLDGLIRAAPQGYATEVGERGLKLSGGEKQRVAIARTILKEPRILNAHESDVRARYEDGEGNSGCAGAGVAQPHHLDYRDRLSTVVGADEIIVLDQGEIVERGAALRVAWRRTAASCQHVENREREAEEAREKLAQVADKEVAPNRNPPLVEDIITEAAASSLEAPADAADVDLRFDSYANRTDTPRKACRSSVCSRSPACCCSGCGRRSAGSARCSTVWCVYFFRDARDAGAVTGSWSRPPTDA